MEEVARTRGTPTSTTTVCAKPPNTDEQPVVVVRGEDAVYVHGVALASINFKYVGVEEVAGTRGAPTCTTTVCAKLPNTY